MLKKISTISDWIVFISLCLLIFCLPFSKAAIESFFGLGCFFWIVKKFCKREYKIYPSELNKPLALFVIINFISVILSENLSLSIKGFIGKLLEYIIIYIMVIETINSKKRLRIMGIVILASVVMILTDGLTQYIRGIDFLRGYPLSDTNKLRASFITRNDFGIWLAIILNFCLSLVLFGKIKLMSLRIATFTLIALLSISFILTYSRGAWFSFAIGILFMSLFLAFKKRLYLLGTVIIIIFISLYTVNIDSASTFQRINLWKEALMIIGDFPIFGTGLNTYTIVAPKYALTAETGIYAHNCYLQMAAETGIAGLFSFFWLLVVLFESKIKYLHSYKDPALLGILAGIIVFLTHNFIDVGLYSLQFAALFWFMLGMAVAITKLEPVSNK